MEEYIKIILGGILGAITRSIPDIFKFIVSICKSPPTSLDEIKGNWQHYIWWPKKNEVSFEEMSVVVKKKRIGNKYKVDFRDKDNWYSGYAFLADNDICIQLHLHGTNKKNSTIHRYNISSRKPNDILVGFWLSRDYNENISCGGVILSRASLDASQIDKIVSERYVIKGDLPLIVSSR